MKKTLSIILTIIMCFTSFALGAGAETEQGPFTEGYYTYTVKDGKATIVSTDTSINGDITVPSSLGGYPVTVLGAYAFKNCVNLKSVEIPDGITELTGGTFTNCTKLETVTMTDSVTMMGHEAFKYCYSLKNLTLSDNIEYIGYYTFEGASSIEYINLPKNLKTVYGVSFSTWLLKELVFPESVEYINGYTLLSAPTMRKIVVGSKAQIHDSTQNTFGNLVSLTDFYVYNPEFELEGTYLGHLWMTPKDITLDELNEICKDIAKALTENDENKAMEIMTELGNHMNHYQENEPVISDILTIHGYKGSTAEAYAEKYGIKFVDLAQEECEKHIDENEDGKCDLCGADVPVEPCECFCHKDNGFAKVTRLIYTFLSLLANKKISCCDDMESFFFYSIGDLT